MNYVKFLNLTSLARKPSPIRILTALKAQSGPSMISLAGGSPNPLLFPFQQATFELWNGKNLYLNEDSLKVALQYDASSGNAHLIKTLKKLQKHLHNPPYSKSNEMDLCISYGATDGLTKSFEMLIGTGDEVLVEQPLCPHVISALRPLGCTLLPLDTDSHGITPLSLTQAIQQNRGNKLKFIFTSPNASVPGGITTSLERRKMVYKFAQEHDLLILENDPFYFLQYVQDKIPSYLSMDIDGRVLRFDSLSMIISPGMRIGFVTGAKPLIERIVLHLMVSSMHVPTLPQVMVSELLNELGIDGYEIYARKVSEHFKRKRDYVLKMAEKYLKDLVDWVVPEGGVCLWMKMKKKHPYVNQIVECLETNNVAFASGRHFFLAPPVNANEFIVVFFYHCYENDLDSIDNAFEDLSKKLRSAH